MEEGEYEKEKNSGGVVAADSHMEEMVGAIEENEAEAASGIERGTTREVVIAEA